ncbi:MULTISPECIES: hypothetical protein [Sphingobium]|uniref:hypothetical protein n=1 Tax=Sphingobium TaxID=165695 RepID=UPI0015EC5BED|nr:MULTISPECIES: hypothetical protein [Sphingobium]MCW2363864.1 hypothetical protein [Sphingobium sp. B10D3B]MCW2402739.1 hypothetical protein [Sphingobium sp. B10D7B]MCW2409718.1 hypothetical protein [Sphingobium xanthum]
MNARSIFMLSIIIAATACGQNPEQAHIEQAQEAVRALLTDPASAQFRNVVIHNDREGRPHSVCGEVNGKNRMGGYAGFEDFYYVLANRQAAIDPGIVPSLDPLLGAKGHYEYMNVRLKVCEAVSLPTIEESNAARDKALRELKALNEDGK